MIENLFLSVGAMKAGTTWLYEQLKNHPEIYFTPEKEIHYFANKVGIESQLNHRSRVEKLKNCINLYHAGNLKYISEHADEIAWYAEYARPKVITNDWYEGLFRLNPGRNFCADFSNLYCQMGEDGWANVRDVAKRTKVIYTLRDPLSRLWSHYKFHMKWVKREDEALEVGFDHFKELLNKSWFWINAEYAANYQRLKENVADGDLLVLYFEDFRADPAQKLAEVQEFLGISRTEHGAAMLDKKVNMTKEFSIPADWLEYMKAKLRPLCEQMQANGIWHKRWQEF